MTAHDQTGAHRAGPVRLTWHGCAGRCSVLWILASLIALSVCRDDVAPQLPDPREPELPDTWERTDRTPPELFAAAEALGAAGLALRPRGEANAQSRRVRSIEVLRHAMKLGIGAQLNPERRNEDGVTRLSLLASRVVPAIAEQEQALLADPHLVATEARVDLDHLPLPFGLQEGQGSSEIHRVLGAASRQLTLTAPSWGRIELYGERGVELEYDRSDRLVRARFYLVTAALDPSDGIQQPYSRPLWDRLTATTSRLAVLREFGEPDHQLPTDGELPYIFVYREEGATWTLRFWHQFELLGFVDVDWTP